MKMNMEDNKVNMVATLMTCCIGIRVVTECLKKIVMTCHKLVRDWEA